MIYSVTHVTRYHYRAVVPYTRCVLRLTPVDRPGQTVLDADLSIDPKPVERADATDYFGNRVTRATIRAPHDGLELKAAATVRVDPLPRPPPEATPAFEAVARLAATGRSIGPDAAVHAVFPSRLVPIFDEATAYAARSFPAGRAILDGAMDLNRRLQAEFAYDPAATDVTTPAQTVLATRRGVCQDFAHVMIAGLRGLGLPARYVSGYLRTVPPAGRARLAGADATHAWVDVWCGPDAGWIGLDPTNAIPAGDSHLVLAVGRDYADVAPVDGVVVSSGQQGLSVAVDVIEVDRSAPQADTKSGAEVAT